MTTDGESIDDRLRAVEQGFVVLSGITKRNEKAIVDVTANLANHQLASSLLSEQIAGFRGAVTAQIKSLGDIEVRNAEAVEKRLDRVRESILALATRITVAEVKIENPASGAAVRDRDNDTDVAIAKVRWAFLSDSRFWGVAAILALGVAAALGASVSEILGGISTLLPTGGTP